ncbi:MAG TPA: TfoX/Sxy family protein [Sphingobacteriaceae bacterium]
MAYNEKLAIRIREYLVETPGVEENKMMGGLTFMINDKMTVGIYKDEMMCRIPPELHEKMIQRPGCRTMDFTKRPMIGYVLISDEGMRSAKDFAFWMDLCVEFNKRSKSSKKKNKS